MLNNIKLRMFFFLILKQCPVQRVFDKLEPVFQALWEKKSKQFRAPEQTAADVYERAGIYSEFGKIICISVGIMKIKEFSFIRLKSFSGMMKRLCLTEFSDLVTKFCKLHKDAILCAHNGREFDFPYIARRMIINRLDHP